MLKKWQGQNYNYAQISINVCNIHQYSYMYSKSVIIINDSKIIISLDIARREKMRVKKVTSPCLTQRKTSLPSLEMTM